MFTSIDQPPATQAVLTAFQNLLSRVHGNYSVRGFEGCLRTSLTGL